VNYITFYKSYITITGMVWINFVIHLYGIIMPLLTIIIVLIVAGIFLYLVNNYIPMDGKIKTILNVVVVIAVIVWLLKLFGVLSYLKDINI